MRVRYMCAVGVGLAACAGTSATPSQPAAYLWMRYFGNGNDGFATAVDRADAIAYYQRSSAGLGGTPGTSRSPGVVPDTLRAFKVQFNIPTRAHGESVHAYRQRIGAAVYFNGYELGLGRELVCSGPWDGAVGRAGFVDSDGVSIGLACFVTNYGGGPEDDFYDPDGAMDNALADAPRAKNTVAITFRPTQGLEEGTQFWVYDGDGVLQDYAQLDDDGHSTVLEQARPVPSVCTECHGGVYVPEWGVARNARFLPVNPIAVDTTRSTVDVQELFRRWNCAALEGGTLTDTQRAFLDALYTRDGAGACTPGQPPSAEPVLEGWSEPHAAALWTEAVLPYCGACHMSFEAPKLVDDYALFTAMRPGSELFGDHDSGATMPHAMPTWQALWGSGPVDALDASGGPRTYDSAGDFLADSVGH